MSVFYESTRWFFLVEALFALILNNGKPSFGLFILNQRKLDISPINSRLIYVEGSKMSKLLFNTNT
jgi:hypothetical protein